MLVPQNRLLAAIAALVLPLAVVAALAPGAAVAAAGVVALLLLVAAADALAALQIRRTPGVRAEFPEVVRLSKDRSGAIPFFLHNERPGAPARRLRLALAFPAEIEAPEAEMAVSLPAGAPRAAFDWRCTARLRGRLLLERVYFEEASPLGLWAARRSAFIGCELRVYPDLLVERRQVAAIFLHHGQIGSHARRQVGRGREFEKLRDYIAGDSIEDISWKATARRQRPVSKVFQIERTQEVYVIIDHSRLSARPAPRPPGIDSPGAHVTTLERYVTSALLLALAAERQGDNFGLATFAEHVGGFVRARGGAGHFDTCREALYALQPALVSPDFEEACAFLRLRLRRRALLVILTALDDPVLAESFIRHVGLLSRQHLVLVNTLRPRGVRPLFEEADAAAVENIRRADDVYRRLGGHLQWQKLREVEMALRPRGVRFSLLDREQLTAQLITQYLNVKQRQIL